MATRPVLYWQSPQEDVDSVDTLIGYLRGLHVTGGKTHIALPTVYGKYYQGDMERPTYRVLGDELCPTTLEGFVELRDRFEAAGFPCWGWSVPRGNTGDDYAEGYRHGQVASCFPRGFILNTEWGWSGFWTAPTNPGKWNTWASGFWQAVHDAGMDKVLGGRGARVGATFVVNVQPNGSPGAMMNSSSVEFDKAVVGSVSFVAIEAYGPTGSGCLDPAKDIPWMSRYLKEIGYGRMRVVTMLEPAPGRDLAAQIRTWHGVQKYGCHVWTAREAARHFGAAGVQAGVVAAAATGAAALYVPERLLATVERASADKAA